MLPVGLTGSDMHCPVISVRQSRLFRLMTWLVLPALLGTEPVAAGLITHREETRDDRFEPWGTDDPSFSPDPLSVLGPPLSPLALFPSLWQRHHSGDVVGLHMLKAREEAPLARSKPLPAMAPVTRSTLASPWGVKRDLQKTYREMFDNPDSTAEPQKDAAETVPEVQGGQSGGQRGRGRPNRAN